MKEEIIKILIIVVALILLATFVGCDKESKDPNEWVISEPDNPILYIGYDTLRLQVGSSIKYVEIGDPNIIVTYFEPNKPTNLCIGLGLNAPDGFIIKGCYFNMVPEPEPNEPIEIDATGAEISICELCSPTSLDELRLCPGYESNESEGKVE